MKIHQLIPVPTQSWWHQSGPLRSSFFFFCCCFLFFSLMAIPKLFAQPTVTAFSLYRLSKTLDYTTSFTPGNPASATAIEVPTNIWTLELTFSEAVVPPPGKGNPSFNTLAEVTELLRLESGNGGVSGDLLTVANLAASVSAVTNLHHSADGKTLRFSLKLKTALKPGHTYTLSLDPAKAVAKADGTTNARAFSAVFSTAGAVQVLPGGGSPTILCNSGRPKILPPVIISEQSAGSFAVGKGKLVLAFDHQEMTITRAPTVTLVGAAGDFLLPTAKLSASGKQLEIAYDFTDFKEVSGLMLSGMEVASTATTAGITVASLKPVGLGSSFDHFTGLSSSTIFTQVNTTHLTMVGGPARPIKITGPMTVCQGSVSTGNRFTYVAAPVAGVTGYHWKLPVGFTTTDPEATLIVVSGNRAYHTPDNQITLSVEPSATLGHHHELEVRSVSDCHLSVLARKLRITVAPAPNPKVSLPAAKFANDLGSSVVITVTNSPAGGVGTLRGDGVVGDKLYPGLLRPGKGYKVYYDYSINNCSITAETSFEIYDPDAIAGGLLRAYCSDENAAKTVTIDDLAAASSVKLYSPRPGNVLIPLSSKLLAGVGTYEFTFNPKTLFEAYGSGTYRFEVIQASLPGTITTVTFEIREPPNQSITGPGVVCGDEATIYNYTSSVPASGSDGFLWEIVSENSKGNGNGYGMIVGDLDTGPGVSVIWKNGTVAGIKDTLRLTQIRGGCPTVTNYPIKIFAAPLPVIVGQRQVCPGEEVTYRLKKSGTSIRSTYEWHLSDSSDGVIVGASDKETVTVKWGEGVGGTVIVTQRFQGGCEGSSNLFVATKLLPKLTIAGFDPANMRVFCAGDTNKVVLTPVFDSDPALLPADYLTSGYFEIRRVHGAAKAPTPFLRIGGETLVKPIASRVAKADFIPAHPISQEPQIVYSASTQETNQNVGEYVLRYVYTHPTKGCVIRSPAYKITLRPLPSLSFTGLGQDSYCGNDSPVVLSTFKNGVQTPVLPGFKVRHIVTNQEIRLSGTLLDPSKLFPGRYELVLTYNGSVSECGNASNRDSAMFFNVVAPPENLHIQASRDFNSDTLRFMSVAGNNITEWQWNFGNLLASGAKVNYPVKLAADGAGNGSISNVSYTLKATNRAGCEASLTQSFQVDFSFVGRCLGEVTHFTDKSSILSRNISSWQWDFGDGTKGTSIQHPSHTYTKPGTYWVSLTIGTQIPGVVSGKHQMFYTLRRRIDIFPVIEVTTTKPYLETFIATKGSQGWISHGVVAGKQDLSSWQLNAGGSSGSDSGAWATTGNAESGGSYYPLEQSYVESPCFEISGLPRPMLSFDYQLDTDPGADGVVLLYSVDDGGSWYRLGNVGAGIQWYNSKSILGRPGKRFSTGNEDGQGWSGRSKSTKDKSPTWQTARLSLDEVLSKIKEPGISLQNKQRVRFRFALGSNADNPPSSKFKGFAFDNVAITSRNRQVLLEYFINESLSSAATLDAQVRDLALALPEAIPLHYHTDFPGKDSFNEANDKDPSARVFHYGIRAVPRMVVDGGVGSGSQIKDSLPDLEEVVSTYARRILMPAPFAIRLSSALDKAQKNSLTFSVKITALKAFARPVVVHLVLVDTLAQSGVTGQDYHHIVRQMLPDGAGNFVKARNWRLGDSLRLNLAWDYKRYPVSLDLTTLKAVVFIQDYENKEVYQAITRKIAANQRSNGGSQVTGVAQQKGSHLQKLHLSPNPGSKQVRLRLPREWTPGGKLHWSIQTLGGKLVKRGRIQRTTRDSTPLTLDTSELAEGVYIIQVQIGQKRFWQRFEKINR